MEWSKKMVCPLVMDALLSGRRYVWQTEVGESKTKGGDPIGDDSWFSLSDGKRLDPLFTMDMDEHEEWSDREETELGDESNDRNLDDEDEVFSEDELAIWGEAEQLEDEDALDDLCITVCRRQLTDWPSGNVEEEEEELILFLLYVLDRTRPLLVMPGVVVVACVVPVKPSGWVNSSCWRRSRFRLIFSLINRFSSSVNIHSWLETRREEHQ